MVNSSLTPHERQIGAKPRHRLTESSSRPIRLLCPPRRKLPPQSQQSRRYDTKAAHRASSTVRQCLHRDDPLHIPACRVRQGLELKRVQERSLLLDLRGVHHAHQYRHVEYLVPG